jgi:hypothetical protein
MKVYNQNNSSVWQRTCTLLNCYTPTPISETIKKVWEWSTSQKEIDAARQRLVQIHVDYDNMNGWSDEGVKILKELLHSGKIRQVIEPYMRQLWNRPISWEKASKFRTFHHLLHKALPRLAIRCEFLGVFNDYGDNYILYLHKHKHPQLADKIQYTCKLWNLTERLLEISEGEKAAFTVRHPCLHRTPLLVERNAEGFRILITDSVETEEKHIYSTAIIEKIRKIAVPAKIYCYRGKRARQNDKHTCPVFAINDVKKMAKYAESIFTFVEDYAKPGKSADVMHLAHLPGYMMEMAQSIDFISAYDEEFPPFTGKTIYEEIRSEIVVDENVDYNTKALRKYFKYYCMILEDALKKDEG